VTLLLLVLLAWLVLPLPALVLLGRGMAFGLAAWPGPADDRVPAALGG